MADEPKSKRKGTAGTRYGKGRGHGGPAKGAGAVKKDSIQTHPPFEKGNTTGNLRADGATPSYRVLARAERLELLKESLWADAFDKNLLQRDRHAARDSLLNREEGTPIARNVNLTQPLDGLTDDQLAAAIDALRSAVGDRPGPTGSGTDKADLGEPTSGLPPLH